MRVTLFDKTIELEDYEVIVKTTKEGTLTTAISTEDVFLIELDAKDTNRIYETFLSAIKMLIGSNNISQAVLDAMSPQRVTVDSCIPREKIDK